MTSTLPVGMAEISERLGVRQQSVAQWKHRGNLPPPRWIVSRMPAWNWPDIERWAAGRETVRTQLTAFAFSLYLTIEGVSAESVAPALETAGAQVPIAWHKDRRTLVKFQREAPNYSEAVASAVNLLPFGVVAQGVVQPL